MPHTPAHPLRQQPVGRGTVLIVDASCGTCASCSAGVRVACSTPLHTGGLAGSPVPAAAAAGLVRSVLAVAALSTIPSTTEPIVAIGRDAGSVAVLARRIGFTVVLTAADGRDPELRRRLTEAHPTGRAGVVVSTQSLRDAARAVRRGGYACAAPDAEELPTVTEVVQREITIAEARTARDLIQSLTPGDWADASAALLAQY